MAIAPIPSIPALSTVLPTTGASASAGAGSASATGDSFSSLVSNAVNDLQQSQTTASSDEAQAAAGQGSLADTMVAATQASLDTQVTTDLLDKAVSSYNDIMGMSF